MELSIEKDYMEFMECPVAATLAVIGRKWKPLILFHPARSRHALQRASTGGAAGHLENVDATITRPRARRDHPSQGLRGRPTKVHYSLTDYGQTLKPSLALMCAWEADAALAEPASAAERGLRDVLIPRRFQAKVLRR